MPAGMGAGVAAMPEAGDFVVVRLYIGKCMFTLLLECSQVSSEFTRQI
jgi:hypothetical protein